MKILFLHGWTSTPGGVKPTYLAEHGHEVLNPALPDDDFEAAVAITQAEFDMHQSNEPIPFENSRKPVPNVARSDRPASLMASQKTSHAPISPQSVISPVKTIRLACWTGGVSTILRNAAFIPNNRPNSLASERQAPSLPVGCRSERWMIR